MQSGRPKWVLGRAAVALTAIAIAVATLLGPAGVPVGATSGVTTTFTAFTPTHSTGVLMCARGVRCGPSLGADLAYGQATSSADANGNLSTYTVSRNGTQAYWDNANAAAQACACGGAPAATSIDITVTYTVGHVATTIPRSAPGGVPPADLVLVPDATSAAGGVFAWDWAGCASGTETISTPPPSFDMTTPAGTYTYTTQLSCTGGGQFNPTSATKQLNVGVRVLSLALSMNLAQEIGTASAQLTSISETYNP